MPGEGELAAPSIGRSGSRLGGQLFTCAISQPDEQARKVERACR